MSDDLVAWFAEERGFAQGTKAPHKWVLQAEQELRIAAAALVAKDAEIARLREALEPSGDTKGAYMGEIKDPETKRMVSWTAIKMIMAMISARAALNTQHKGETP